MAAIFREREEDSAGKGKGLASPNVTLTTGDISDPPVDIFDAIRRWIESIFNPKPAPTPTPTSTPNSAISLEKAESIFQDMADETDIAFKFTPDGCYARAHIMTKRIEAEYGIAPEKVWAFGDLDTQQPYAGHSFRWVYHVAPVINVIQPDGSIIKMVIDPSIASHPITVDEWKSQMHDPAARIEITKPNHPPHQDNGSPYPGSGYWPAPDPQEGPDAYSKKIMEMYKNYADKNIWPFGR